MSEEECRRTLKAHQLKITVLRGLENHHREVSGIKSVSGAKSNKKACRLLSPQPLTTFKLLRSKFSVSKRLVGNIRAQVYEKPTQVQIGALPLLLGSYEDLGLAKHAAKKTKKGFTPHVDLLTIAPTCSGKTFCFMIHLLHRLSRDQQATKMQAPEIDITHSVQALILVPTHELADQVANEGKKLALGTGIKVAALKKGMHLPTGEMDGCNDPDASSNEVASGKNGEEGLLSDSSVVKANIIISTPITLLRAIPIDSSKPCCLPDIRFLVLDEADVLLDELFREQTMAIWKACSHSDLRISLWSATISSSIESLSVSFLMNRRKTLGLRSKHHYILRLVVGLKDSAVSNVSHRLIYAASERGKLLALRQLLHPSSASSRDTPSLQPPFLVFTQTIARATALYSELLYDIPVEGGGSSRIAVLHSELSTTARSKIMAGFRKGEVWILVTTDLLSRGIDFQGINGVVNYDIPNTGAAYVHRAGRTGRQGRTGGVAVTLYTKEDIPYVKNVANVIAVSETANGGSAGNDYEKFRRSWLLETLPNVSKKTKKALKSGGVESRRGTAGREGARKSRISTRSGYDRQLENRRIGATIGNQTRLSQYASGYDLSDDEEWQGLD
ncbi:RNA-dependent ATPase rok1 [Lecanora helva]